MKRHVEKDEFGGAIIYKLEAVKKCPICRKKVSEEDVDHIQKNYAENPSLDDNSYS